MKRHSLGLPVGIFLILLLLAACNLNANFSPTANFPTPLEVTPFQPTGPLPTVQLTASLPTAVPQPTSVPPTQAAATQAPAATQPPAATAVALPAGTRLNMLSGRTSAYVNGSLAAGGAQAYLVGAAKGQVLMVKISSTNPAIYLQIQAPDGSTLAAPSEQKNYWQGVLPADGDYIVAAVSTSGAGDFRMSVTIPARVVFASGATTASMSATVGGNDITTFLVHAAQGQNFSVKLISTVGDVYLDIYGLQDGNHYANSSDAHTSFAFNLPSTQDYVVQCINSGDKSEDLIIYFAIQ